MANPWIPPRSGSHDTQHEVRRAGRAYGSYSGGGTVGEWTGDRASTQAQWLHDLLLPIADRVVVCNRRGERQQGNKSDRVDADELSERLRRGGLRSVYHGSTHMMDLKELVGAYRNVVEDTTRVMQRLKALYRARAIRTSGSRLYNPANRDEWLAKLAQAGVRFRAEALYTELDTLLALRPTVKAAMIAEARRNPAWEVLRSIPFLGPVRVAVLLGVLRTPWRFRTKRNLWSYAGLAVKTHTSAEFAIVEGRPVRRRRAPMTRGLNRNHNPVIKDVFRSAANAACGRPGPLQDFYHGMLDRGMDESLARVTVARKLAAATLCLWKKGERFDPELLTAQAR